MLRPLMQNERAAVFHADWRALHRHVKQTGGCDLLFTDTPYSEKTQGGHDASGEIGDRRRINYAFWTSRDVRAFVKAWHPLVRGWFVTITDDVLAPVWRAELERVGRYAFAPLPFVAPGSRVRLVGDGPSCWTTWVVSAGTAEALVGPCEVSGHVVVARPRTREMQKWGTLPGAYILPPGQGGAMPVVGGKPKWLGCEIVRHYSRPGDLVVDPCGGAGTFGVAALLEGRRAIVGDIDEAHAELAALWMTNPERPAPTIEKVSAGLQPSLFEALG